MNNQYAYHSPTEPVKPSKKNTWLVPTIVGVVALFTGVGIGVGGLDTEAEPLPAETVTVEVTTEAEPAPTVTETVEVEVEVAGGNSPECVAAANDAKDIIFIFSEAGLLFAEHLEADAAFLEGILNDDSRPFEAWLQRLEPDAQSLAEYAESALEVYERGNIEACR